VGSAGFVLNTRLVPVLNGIGKRGLLVRVVIARAENGRPLKTEGGKKTVAEDQRVKLGQPLLTIVSVVSS